MHYYIDIQLRVDPEFPAHHLMAALYGKLHRRLALGQFTQVGVSFPGYRVAPSTLGDTLRLIGPASALDRLMAADWLQGMYDHVTLKAMAPVPPHAEPRCLRRVQAKSSPERLRRRHMRRHGLTEDQARERVPDSCAATLTLPFVTLTSASTGQRFRLFLCLSPPQAEAAAGDFGTYGLSGTATIPWF